jgi:adenine-specific DNA-methyltransferase
LKEKLQIDEFNQALTKLNLLKDNPDQDFNHFDWKLDFPEVLNPLVNENTGFDIVIGNPPYVEHKKLKHISSILKPNYKVYTGSSDLSVYFFEKGFNLLNKKGTFAYINTNKFFNTGYGKALRGYLTNKTFRKLVNFEQVEVFEGVLVSSVVFIASNKSPDYNNKFDFVEFKKEKNWKDYFDEKVLNRTKQMSQCDFDENEWVFEIGKAVEIKNRIEAKGTKIKDITGIEIKRGVTTGFDPAFIISSEKASQLGCPDIIKPLFKGEDIKKYKFGNSTKYLINTHNGISKRNIKPVDVPNEYPLIYEHLLKYYDENSEGAIVKPNGQIMCLLNRSDQGDKWYNLRNCAFLDLFDENKIIWPLTADKWGFTIDNEGYYLTSGGFFLVSEKMPLKYLLGIMNSSLMNYYFKFIGVMTAGGAYTLKKASIEILPIIETNKNSESLVVYLVDSILLSKNYSKVILDSIPNTHISEAFEEVIDALVFELYFPEEFVEKGIEIEKYAKDIFKPIDGLSEDEQIKAIQKAYQTMREKKNPLRNQILLMQIELKELLNPILSL